MLFQMFLPCQIFFNELACHKCGCVSVIKLSLFPGLFLCEVVAGLSTTGTDRFGRKLTQGVGRTLLSAEASPLQAAAPGMVESYAWGLSSEEGVCHGHPLCTRAERCRHSCSHYHHCLPKGRLTPHSPAKRLPNVTPLCAFWLDRLLSPHP